jgi:hypothetical protein
MDAESPFRFTIDEALAHLPTRPGNRFATVFQHGSLLIEIYAPRGKDPQQPHTRDELMLLSRAAENFFAGQRVKLLVPAGVDHRCENFTDDLAVRVIFYGPEGGASQSEPPAVAGG